MFFFETSLLDVFNFLTGEYVIHLLILVGIYLILAQSFNICFGLGGLFNLAHVSCYAIGAYVTALLSTELQVGFFLSIAASGLTAGFFSLLIGLISLKLKQDYFAIGTLAFASVVTAVLINWKSVTRGVLGIPGIPRPEIGSIDFNQNVNFLALVCIILVAVYLVCYVVFKSSLARSLRAQSEHEYAAIALGKNVQGVRNDGFIISSSCAGIAGSLFAYYINYIDPSSFGLHEMVFVLSIVVLGSPGSFWGVTLATFFLVLLPEPLRWLELSPSILGPMRQFLYAFILFLAVYWKKEKLFPLRREI